MVGVYESEMECVRAVWAGTSTAKCRLNSQHSRHVLHGGGLTFKCE